MNVPIGVLKPLSTTISRLKTPKISSKFTFKYLLIIKIRPFFYSLSQPSTERRTKGKNAYLKTQNPRHAEELYPISGPNSLSIQPSLKQTNPETIEHLSRMNAIIDKINF